MRAIRVLSTMIGAALVVATMAWSNVAASATTGSVSLTSDTVGLTFVSETVNADGSVTDVWTNSAGWQFEYDGAPGGQMRAVLGSDTTGNTLDMSATSVDGPITSWCVKAIKGPGYYFDACDTRTVIQRQSGNNYIVDQIAGQGQASSGLDYDSVYTSYNWSGNQVVDMRPLGDIGSDCSPDNIGVTWNGISFSGTFITCDGTLHPWGVSQSKGGGIWSVNNGAPAPTGEIAISPMLKTHAPGSDNPLSVLHLRVIWGR